jgi:hypothetical protein
VTRADGKSKTLALLLVAASMPLLVAAFTGRFAVPERWEYSAIAANLLAGRGAIYEYLGSTYYFYGSALYPALLAFVLWIGDQREWLVLPLHAGLFAATCLLIYRMAARTFGETEARVAAGLVVLHPGALIYAGKIHSQTLDTFLVVLTFVLLAHLTRDSGLGRIMAAGLVSGLAILSRGTIAPFIAIWALRFLWGQRRAPSRAALCALALVVGGVLAAGPVIIRGHLLYGSFVPLRTDVGVNLWYGNHVGASGTSYTLSLPPRPVTSQMSPELVSHIAGKSEVDQNRAFLGAVFDFVRQNPLEAVRLFVLKLYYFWWFSPHAGLLYPRTWTSVYSLYYPLIMLLGLVGIVRGLASPEPPARRVAGLFVVLAVSMSITQALFYVEGRHRWQIELLLLMFSSLGLSTLWAARPGSMGAAWKAVSSRRRRCAAS